MPARLALLAPLSLALACAEPGAPDDDGLDRHPVLGACPEDMSQESSQSDPFADCVDEFLPEGAGYGQDSFPAIVLGPPEAGVNGNAGLDVLSLGCGGQVTVFFAGAGVVDGPGPDLLVFENPFVVGDGTFTEPARVLVSDDGVDWRAFACDPAGDEPPRGCAGVALVRASSDNDLDPTDPAEAGGDAFDLADVGLARARWVRLIDVGRDHDPSGLWCTGPSGGFDLDALAAVHAP
jgi:hypothetical protein